MILARSIGIISPALELRPLISTPEFPSLPQTILGKIPTLFTDFSNKENISLSAVSYSFLYSVVL